MGVNELTMMPLRLQLTHSGFKAGGLELRILNSPLEFLDGTPLACQDLSKQRELL
jgi:hypothetical protein